MAGPVIVDGRTKAEIDYVNQYTRYLLAHKWCKNASANPDDKCADCCAAGDEVFWEWAKKKGWISKRNFGPTAAGFKTAAAFMRR